GYESTDTDSDGNYFIYRLDSTTVSNYQGFIFDGSEIELIGGNPLTDFRRLVYADISVTVLNDEGSGLLDAGFTPDSWNEFKAIYGETFSRRVYLMSQPL
ncbi:MAG: hypothetical protein AAGF10_05680, partial [Verrucomicrobiota bacterium]